MGDCLSVLTVENLPGWRNLVRDLLLDELGEDCSDSIVECRDLRTAIDAIQANRFELAIIDLSLSDEEGDSSASDENGIECLESLRADTKNKDCAVVVLTGFATNRRTSALLGKYGVYCVLEKGKVLEQGKPEDGEGSDDWLAFSAENFYSAVRGALRQARVRVAGLAEEESAQLTAALDAKSVTRVSVRDATKISDYRPEKQVAIDWEPLLDLSNLINEALFSNSSDSWRKYSRTLGVTAYNSLIEDPKVSGVFAAAGHAARQGEYTRYRFATPAALVGIPFELLREAKTQDPLCLRGPVSRRLVFAGQFQKTKREPLFDFLERLGERDNALRILFISANADGKIPQVDKEVDELQAQLQRDFGCVGIRVQPETLRIEEATEERLGKLLKQQTFHMLHYAGHGFYRPDQPELSGLVIRDGSKYRALTAPQLKLLVEGTELRLVFLNSCLGARTSQDPGGGDFHGLLDALVRGNVPTVLAHRWQVNDGSALSLASTFYHELSRSFSPEQALFEARRHAARDREDPAWASPILLMQS